MLAGEQRVELRVEDLGALQRGRPRRGEMQAHVLGRVVFREGLVERTRAELRERLGVADRGAPDRDGHRRLTNYMAVHDLQGPTTRADSASSISQAPAPVSPRDREVRIPPSRPSMSTSRPAARPRCRCAGARAPYPRQDSPVSGASSPNVPRFRREGSASSRCARNRSGCPGILRCPPAPRCRTCVPSPRRSRSARASPAGRTNSPRDAGRAPWR